MHAFIHKVAGAVMALCLPAFTAQADQMDVLEQTCTKKLEGFEAHFSHAQSLGWRLNESAPMARQFMANFASLSSLPKVKTFTRTVNGDAFVLALSLGQGIVGCRVLNPTATTAMDRDVFLRRFDVRTNPSLMSMLRIESVFFANATATPVPNPTFMQGRRSKTDRGLTGQLMSASYFAK